MAIIELESVTKRYRAARGFVDALRDLTATVDGRLIGLLGPNGAGKSTLLRSLLGLTPFTGRARVLGLDPRAASLEIRARVGYMPESDCHLAGMSAVEYCAYAAELAGLPRADAIQRAHAALYYASLEDKRYLPVDGYSTGLKQRVKLAQALVHDPDLLFLDEPTNGLDPGSREEMLRLIAALPAQRNAAVVLSTHLLADVERYCDHVIVLDRGQLLYGGTIAELTGSGDEGRVRVRTKTGGEDQGRLAAALADRGCGVDEDGAGLIVTLPAGARTDVIFEAALALGVQVRHLAPHRVSLEDAFLRRLQA